MIMQNEKNKIQHIQVNIQGQCQGRVGFMEWLERIRQSVEVETFCRKDRPQAEELCKIIAEVMVLPSESPMQIGRTKIAAGTVAEVYSLLTAEHLEIVIRNFNNLDYEVKYKRSYLRTALYNAVFEAESTVAQWANLIYGEK